jgi:hypothetical protein
MLLLGCGIPAFLLFLGDRPGPAVLYVFPNGFRGSFRVFEDRTAAGVPMVGGKYVVSIPKDGFLSVKDLSFLSQWHVEEARFENGTPLATLPSKTEPGLAVFSGGISTNGAPGVRWTDGFVGTWREAYDLGGLGKARASWKGKGLAP